MLGRDDHGAGVGGGGADLLLTGLIFEQPAANVAEYHDIPLATLHFFPARAHGRLLPFAAGAVEPRGNDGERLAGLARDEEGRGRPAS